MRVELMWIGWFSGSTLFQDTSVMMSVFIFNGTSGRVDMAGWSCATPHTAQYPVVIMGLSRTGKCLDRLG
eukprot:1143769-Pelagomonas_calceolata.AAC.1